MWLNFLYYKPWYIQSNHNRCNRVESLSNSLTFVKMNAPVSHSFFLCLSLSVIVSQITVFRMGSEGHQDIDLAILTALLKGGCVHSCVCAGAWMYSKRLPFHCRPGCCYLEASVHKRRMISLQKAFLSLPQFRCMLKAHKYVFAFSVRSSGIKLIHLCFFYSFLKLH